jgi:virginiamycin B lyase
VGEAALDGSMQTFEMPEGSGPHGIVFDAKGQLWVSLEFAGEIVRLDTAGTIVQTIDVKSRAPRAPRR